MKFCSRSLSSLFLQSIILPLSLSLSLSLQFCLSLSTLCLVLHSLHKNMASYEGMFSALEMLAEVCCRILDQEQKILSTDHETSTKEDSVANLIKPLKFARPVLKFRTKTRDTPRQPRRYIKEQHKIMIAICTSADCIHHNNDHRQQHPVLPLKKRHHSLLDHEEDDQILVCPTKRRCLVLNGSRNGLKKEEKKTATAIPKRKTNKGFHKKTIRAGPDPAPELTNAVKEKIVEELGEYSDLRLVIQKSLFDSDLLKSQNRISIPLKQIKSDDFLTEEEKRKLATRKQDSNHLEGIELDFIQPDLRKPKTKMMLKKWGFKKTSSLMLSRNWYRVATANKLKENDVVQIWFFRRREGNSPCIALVNLSR